LGIWKREGFKAAFDHINGFFLIALFGGILTSILSLAKFISWALETHPVPVWSFFFGLILVSVYHMIKQVEQKTLSRFVFLLLGAVFAYSITVLKPLQMDPTSLNIFFAGCIAICAMILPGISGSFILLLLGMYTPVLGAVKGLQLDVMAIFAMGCLIGLLSFSHVLSWLLKRFRDFALVFLTGLMLGTLPKLWPWKETISWRTNSKGEQVPLIQENLSPFNFESVTGQPSQLATAVVLMLVGIGLVLALEKVAEKGEK
jgi:putative membrane protein